MCPARLSWSLVVGQEGERIFAIQIQSPLQSRKQRQKCFSKAGDSPALVGDEVATASEEELKLGDLMFTCLELA